MLTTNQKDTDVSPTPRRKPRYRSTHELLGGVRRMLRSAGQRAGGADEPELADLLSIQNDLDAAISAAVARQREQGKTWATIGLLAGGLSKQGAQQRFERRRA